MSAAQVFLGFAKGSRGEHRTGAEGRIGIDQANVEGAGHAQVLHAVIKDQGIGTEFLNASLVEDFPVDELHDCDVAHLGDIDPLVGWHGRPGGGVDVGLEQRETEA